MHLEQPVASVHVAQSARHAAHTPALTHQLGLHVLQVFPSSLHTAQLGTMGSQAAGAFLVHLPSARV